MEDFMTLADFFANIGGAKISFEAIGAFFKDLYNTFAANETVLGIWNAAEGARAGVKGFIPVILLVLSLVLAFAGRKLLGLVKFLACFVIGFCAGATYVAPLLGFVPPYVTALVLGFIAGILGKLVYKLAVLFAAGYGVYYIAFSGTLLPAITQYTANNTVIAVVVAVIAIVLVFVLLKLVEMLGTATLGAWLAVLCIINLYDFTALIPGQEMLVKNIAVAVIALIALFVQIKTRKRY